jgi:DNA-binding transcriptional MocR family regulator
MHDREMPLYQALATELANAIEAGGLKPAQRLPSVRRLATQRGVSITTAVATLRHLEERGLIQARPKSGYFVAQRRSPLPEPAPVELPRRARLVGVLAMMKRLADAGLTPKEHGIASAILHEGGPIALHSVDLGPLSAKLAPYTTDALAHGYNNGLILTAVACTAAAVIAAVFVGFRPGGTRPTEAEGSPA